MKTLQDIFGPASEQDLRSWAESYLEDPSDWPRRVNGSIEEIRCALHSVMEGTQSREEIYAKQVANAAAEKAALDLRIKAVNGLDSEKIKALLALEASKLGDSTNGPSQTEFSDGGLRIFAWLHRGDRLLTLTWVTGGDDYAVALGEHSGPDNGSGFGMNTRD